MAKQAGLIARKPANMKAGKDKGKSSSGSRPVRAETRMCYSSSSSVHSKNGKAVDSHIALARNSSNSGEFLPLHTLLLQCSDVYQLQDAILEKSIRELRELSGHSQLDKDKCEKLFRQLEVHRTFFVVFCLLY